MNINFAYPYAIFTLLVLVPVIFLIFRTFVKFTSKEEKQEHIKNRKGLRIFVLIMRILIIVSLTFALMSPHLIEEKVDMGQPRLKVLVDNSTSMSLYSTDFVENLQKNVGGSIETEIRRVGSSTRSNIGDLILNNLEEDDNILLISDGNNNYGKDLGDVLAFASKMNATISAVNLVPVSTDYSVSIIGPRESIRGSTNDYYVEVEQVGEKKTCTMVVKIDQKQIYGGDCLSKEFSHAFSEGYHTITATLDTDDSIDENNQFIKAVKVVAQPKVLFVSEKSSSLAESLDAIYDLDIVSSLPGTISGYRAVILDDIPASKLNSKVDMLSSYISEGNGLFVIGGKDSFDKGNYLDSKLETLLPVKVGQGLRKSNSDLNVVFLIDLSHSVRDPYNSQYSVIDMEKASLLNLLNELRPEDNFGIYAFTSVTQEITPLGPLTEKDSVVDKVKSLRSINNAGTRFDLGIGKANAVLTNVKGSKNIILISDGEDNTPEATISRAGILQQEGIKVFTVDLGHGKYASHLRMIADMTRGAYFRIEDTNRLALLFSQKSDEAQGKTFGLTVLDDRHFITGNLQLTGYVTGYNQVVPKPQARYLIVNSNGDPLLSVWRLGLGKVAALSTDDGSAWAANLLNERNSRVFTRTLNWVIGDLSKDSNYDVDAQDVFLGGDVEYIITSASEPNEEKFQISKIDDNLYSAGFTPEKTGFYDYFDAKVAVNSFEEYYDIGINPELKDLVALSKGEMFEQDDYEGIIEKAVSFSKRLKATTVYYRWPFVLLAAILFLVEIIVRRIIENKKGV